MTKIIWKFCLLNHLMIIQCFFNCQGGFPFIRFFQYSCLNIYWRVWSVLLTPASGNISRLHRGLRMTMIKTKNQHDTSVGQRKKSESPTGVEPMNSRTSGGCLIHQNGPLKNPWRARSLNWVHVWQASCILLGTAMSKSSWLMTNEINDSGFNFKLGDK